MKPEIKARLIEALRSGKYKQTVGAMKKGNCFCVAGVLCDLYAKDQGVSWVPHPAQLVNHPGYTGIETLLGDWSSPPHQVVDWADANHECYGPEENYEDEIEMLMAWNDGYNFTFQQMADMLERLE